MNRKLLTQLMHTLLMTLVTLFLLDRVEPGFVSSFLSLKTILLVLICAGIGLFRMRKQAQKNSSDSGVSDAPVSYGQIAIVLIVSSMTSFFIYERTISIVTFGLPLALMSFIIFLCLGLFFLAEGKPLTYTKKV